MGRPRKEDQDLNTQVGVNDATPHLQADANAAIMQMADAIVDPGYEVFLEGEAPTQEEYERFLKWQKGQWQKEDNAVSVAPKKQVTTTSGEPLQQYEIWTVDIEMGTRPSTSPDKPGKEGYATRASFLKLFRSFKATASEAKKLNDYVNWTLVGQPHHISWAVPAGTAQPGLSVTPNCFHEEIKQGRSVIGYVYRMNIPVNE